MFKVAVFVCCIFCSSLVSAQESITVAVASSYYEKVKAYAAQFEAKHDVAVRLVLGSTGRLYNQSNKLHRLIFGLLQVHSI